VAVTIAGQMAALFETLGRKFGPLHSTLHSIAFAPKTDLHDPLRGCSRAGFMKAMGLLGGQLHQDGAAGTVRLRGRVQSARRRVLRGQQQQSDQPRLSDAGALSSRAADAQRERAAALAP